MPSLGTFADAWTAGFPLVFVGEGLDTISVRPQRGTALIQARRALFAEKIRCAHEAGAEFTIVFNHQNNDETILMAGTDFSAVPALSINQNAGETRASLLQNQSDITAKISLNTASIEFNVPDTLICEQVGPQLDTAHTHRGGLRIALLSSRGYPSTLQTTNAADTAGLQPYIYGPSNTSSNPT